MAVGKEEGGFQIQVQGTHSTKTRAEVSGGGRKPFKQKGTGRARQGSIRAPQMRGGGIVHGPKPRDYSFKVNKMVRRAALKAALSAKVKAGQFILVDKLVLDEAEAERFLEQQIEAHQDVLSDLETYRSGGRGFGLRSWIVDTLAGEYAPPELPVVEGIMQRLKEEGVEFVKTQARTNLFKNEIIKLLPPEWDATPENYTLSNEIVRSLNSGMSEGRLAKQEKRRAPKARASILIIDTSKDGQDGGTLLRRATANLPLVDVLPVVGANVYDVIRHDYLVVTMPALHALVDRLMRPINRAFKPLGYDLASWEAQQKSLHERDEARAARLPAWLEAVKAARATSRT